MIFCFKWGSLMQWLMLLLVVGRGQRFQLWNQSRTKCKIRDVTMDVQWLWPFPGSRRSIALDALCLWSFFISEWICTAVDLNLLLCRYSPFLMACFNPETEEYQSVCRVMSGFSDSFYIEVKVVLTYPLKYSGHANYVSTVEDAEPSGLCQLTLKYPKHFV
jgi:hypothetical protein